MDTLGGHEVLAVLEVLDRDGQVRQAHRITHWPLRVGRALDNDVVLSDPYVAAHHLRIEPEGVAAADAQGAHGGAAGDGAASLLVHEHEVEHRHAPVPAGGLVLQVGDSRNGVSAGRQRWRAGQRVPLVGDGPVPEFTAGRTRLRLRLPGQALADELPLAVTPAGMRRHALLAGAFVLVIAGLLFGTYLDSDPDGLPRAVAGVLLATAVATAAWCGLWALLSKTFTRQGRFGWHLRVFVLASAALLIVDALPRLLAFAFSWPALSNYAFVVSFGVGAAALYFHLLAVEPGRPRLMRAVAVVAWVVGVTMSVWFNQQRNDHFGEELYMTSLFPPGARLAAPIPVERFIDRAASLRDVLDRKAKEPPFSDATGARDDE